MVKPVVGKVRCFLTLSLLLCLSRLNRGSYILIDLCTLAFMRKISWSELHYITGLSGKGTQKAECAGDTSLMQKTPTTHGIFKGKTEVIFTLFRRCYVVYDYAQSHYSTRGNYNNPISMASRHRRSPPHSHLGSRREEKGYKRCFLTEKLVCNTHMVIT